MTRNQKWNWNIRIGHILEFAPEEEAAEELAAEEASPEEEVA